MLEQLDQRKMRSINKHWPGKTRGLQHQPFQKIFHEGSLTSQVIRFTNFHAIVTKNVICGSHMKVKVGDDLSHQVLIAYELKVPLSH